MKYRAKSDGTIGKGAVVRRVRAGEVFTLPEGTKPGKWMEPLPESAAPEPKAKKQPAKGPSTFSEVAKADAKALAPKGGEDLV